MSAPARAASLQGKAPADLTRGSLGRAAAPLAIGVGAVALSVATALTGNPAPMAAALAMAMAVVVLGRPEVATPVFMFVFYLNLPAVAARFHGVPPLVASLAALVLLLPALRYVVIDRKPLLFPRPYVLMFLYLGASLVSALASADPESSALALSLFLSEGLLLYIVVVNVIRTREMLRWVIWALILAGALMGSISIWQELTHSYGNNFGGLAQVNEVGFKVGEDLAGKVIRPRLAGPIGEQNRYAQTLVVLLPLAVLGLWDERRPAGRILAGLCAALILAAILLTFSRGAAVAVAGLFVVMVALGYMRLRQLVLVTALVIGLIAVVAPQYLIRLDSLTGIGGLIGTTNRDPDGAIVGRATSNLAALNAFLDHPIVGVGPGQYFRQYSQEYGNELGLRHFDNQRRAHNLYLEIAADLGILGFSAFMAIIAATLYPLWTVTRRLAAKRPDLANLGGAFLLSILGYLFTGMFLHLSYERYFWVLLALGAGAAHVLRAEANLPADAAPLERSPRSPQTRAVAGSQG